MVQTTGHDTDAVRKIQSGMHLWFPEYTFRINAIMVNEGKVGTSCRAKDIPECKIRKDSALDSFERESLMWVWTVTTTNTFSLTVLMT